MFFVKQVSEINLRECDGQIFYQRANLQRIEGDVDGRVLVLIIEREEDNVVGEANGCVHVFVSDAVEERAHGKAPFKQKLFGGTLSIGIQGGMLSEGFKGSEIDTETPGDPAFVTTDVTGTALDLSAGLYYQRKSWYAGVSILHAMAPEVELGEKSILEISRMYYLTGGYNIRLRNPFLTIHPTVLARTDGTVYRVDVTARVKYTHDRKMLYGGVGYSPSNSVTAMIGGNFHGICLGYSYEMFTSGTGIGHGSHELFVGYQTELNLYKKGRNRHQSVRIL